MATTYTTETRTDANGQPYTVRIPNNNVITSDDLQPTTPVQIATPTPDTTNYAGITGGVYDSVLNDYNTLKQKSESKLNTQENTASDIETLMKDITGKTDYTAQVNKEQGVDTETENLNKFTQQLSDLNAQATSLNREAQAIPLQVQEANKNTGATDAGVAPQTAGALRLNALKALSIAQQSDIAYAAATGSQMRLNAAKSKAQQIIDLKYKPLEDALALKKQQYDLNKDILAEYDKKRTEALGIQLEKEKQNLEDIRTREKRNSDNAISYAKYAMDGGQSDLAAQIQSLDISSETFEQDLAKLQKQITNPVAKLDIAIKQAQLAKLQKETSLLGEPTAKEKKEEADKLKSTQGQIETLRQKIGLIDAINNSGGISARVGTSPLTRKGVGWENINPLTYLKGLGDIYSDLSGKGQQFAGGIHQLTSQEFLDALINAKSQGATFGALTDREGDALRAAATKINDWEIKDKSGKGVGIWNIDERSFNSELEKIKELANASILRSQGTLLNSEEQATLDEVFNNTNPSNFYK